MTLSPWLAVFWAALCFTVIAAIQTRNRHVIQAAALLAAHQAMALGASFLTQSKIIYELYGVLSFGFWALCLAVWRSHHPRWTDWFTAGFVLLLGINAFAFWFRTETTLAVWPLTLVLYAMMALILWRCWHERASQGGMGFLAPARASLRHQLAETNVLKGQAKRTG